MDTLCNLYNLMQTLEWVFESTPPTAQIHINFQILPNSLVFTSGYIY